MIYLHIIINFVRTVALSRLLLCLLNICLMKMNFRYLLPKILKGRHTSLPRTIKLCYALSNVIWGIQQLLSWICFCCEGYQVHKDSNIFFRMLSPFFSQLHQKT